MKDIKDFIDDSLYLTEAEIKDVKNAENPFPDSPNKAFRKTDFAKIMAYLVGRLGADYIMPKQEFVKENKWRTAPNYVHKAVREGSKLDVAAICYQGDKPKTVKKSDIFKNTSDKWVITVCDSRFPDVVHNIWAKEKILDSGRFVETNYLDPWDTRKSVPVSDLGLQLSELE